MVELPIGEHNYKYLVDGAWKYDPDEVAFHLSAPSHWLCVS